MRRGTSATLQTPLTTWAIFTGLLQALQKGWAHLVHRPPAGAPAVSSAASGGEAGSRARREPRGASVQPPHPQRPSARLCWHRLPRAERPPRLPPRSLHWYGPMRMRLRRTAPLKGEAGGSQAAGPFPGGSRRGAEGPGEAEWGRGMGEWGGALPPARHGRGPGPLSSTSGLGGRPG